MSMWNASHSCTSLGINSSNKVSYQLRRINPIMTGIIKVILLLQVHSAVGHNTGR